MRHSLRNWRCLLTCAVLATALPLCARNNTPATGRLLGLVTDAMGRPEAGAVVQARRTGLHTPALTSTTDAQGTFSLKGLLPGTYYIEIGKGSAIASRRKVDVHANSSSVVVVSLPALLESVHFGAPGSNAARDDHEFRWILRESTTNRPVLRLIGEPLDIESTSARDLSGYVAVMAGGGARAFDTPGGLATAFNVETGLWAGTRMALSGSLGMAPGLPDSQVQAQFQPANPASQSRFVVSVRELGTSAVGKLPPLRVVSLNYSNGVDFGDRLHLQYGSMLNTVSMVNSMHTLDPYARLTYRLSSNAQVEYRFADAVPPVMFGRSGVEAVDPTPQVTMTDFHPHIERARHQELQYSDNLTPNDVLQAAVISDRYKNAVVNGRMPDSMPALMVSGNFLPDLFSNMFSTSGGSYGGNGFRVAYLHRFGEDLSMALGYTNGMVLAPTSPNLQNSSSLISSLTAARRDAWTIRLEATTPRTHTRLICSYRGLNGPSATGLDLYDDSFAQSDSFANLTVRQPLPRFFGSGGSRVEALLEFRNLLAQGYLPFVSADGKTVYLIQSARSFRGGFSINF